MKHSIVYLIALMSSGPPASQSDPWAALRALEGKWKGQATGVSGKGISLREYRFELGGRFLSARNRSEYDPKPPGAKAEIHEDMGMFSYDRTLKKVVFRQFHSEGFVNEYTLESVSDSGKRLEFVTTRIKNIAPGWRARESYQIITADEIIETFSLAAPSKDFEVYSTTRLKRVN